MAEIIDLFSGARHSSPSLQTPKSVASAGSIPAKSTATHANVEMWEVAIAVAFYARKKDYRTARRLMELMAGMNMAVNWHTVSRELFDLIQRADLGFAMTGVDSKR